MPKNVPEKLTKARLWDAAVLVKDLEKTVKHFKALGIGEEVHGAPPEGAEGLFYKDKPLQSEMKAYLTRVGNMNLEFIQPDETPNPWKKFLKDNGEGIHHLGFRVDDVEKELNRLTALGAEVPFYGKIKGKIGAAYVDLKIANLNIELTAFGDSSPVCPNAWDAGVVVKDIGKTKKHLEGLGIGEAVATHIPDGAEGLYYNDKLLTSKLQVSSIQVGNMILELVQPDDTPNPWKDFLKTRGEGIHHIGFQVKDVAKEVKRLTDRGAELILYGNIHGKMGAAYIDLKVANLILEFSSFNEVG